jgi:O-antigen ligase
VGQLLRKLQLAPLALVLGLVPLIVFLHRTPVPRDYRQHWITDHVYDFFSYYKAQALGLCSLLLLAMLLTLYCLDRLPARKPWFFLPLAPYAASIVVSSLAAEHKHIAFNGYFERSEGMWVLLAYLVVCAGAYFLVSEPSDVRLLLAAMACSLAVMAPIGLFQFLGMDPFNTLSVKKLILPARYHAAASGLDFVFDRHIIYATLSNPNYVGSMMAIACPIAVVLFTFSEQRRTSMLLFLILSVALFMLLGSNARAAWVATGVAIVAVIALVRSSPPRRFWMRLGLVVVLACAQFAVLNWLSRGAIAARVAMPEVGAPAGGAVVVGRGETWTERSIREYGNLASCRVYIWLRSMPMLTKTVLVGRGPDTFGVYFDSRDPYKAFCMSKETFIDKPHNTYLQIWVNLGGLALASFLLTMLLHLRRAARLIRGARGDPPRCAWPAALFAGCFGYLVAAMFYDSAVSVAPTFWVVLGMSLAVTEWRAPTPQTSRCKQA